MRLSRPRIGQPDLLVDLEKEPGSDSAAPLSFTVDEAAPNGRDAPPLLSLPSNFGSLYVGETFRAILSLHSEVTAQTAASLLQTPGSTGPVTSPPHLSVTISVAVATPTREQPVSLIHPTHPDSTTVLAPGANRQYIVEFETADVGVHTVSASVTYTPIQVPPEEQQVPAEITEITEAEESGGNIVRVESGSDPLSRLSSPAPPRSSNGLVAVALAPPLTYTKSYRFTTAAGFSVGTKMTAVAHDTYLLETRIENATDTTVTLETAEFLAPAGWVARPLALPEEEDDALGEDSDEQDRLDALLQDSKVAVFVGGGDAPALMPKEAWQFAYLVQHDADFFAKAAAAAGPANNTQALSQLPASLPPPPSAQTQRKLQPGAGGGPSLARQSVDTGKFRFSWRREFLGEKGWMITGHLKRTTKLEYWG